MSKKQIFNTLNQRIEMLPIDKFLLDYPRYGNKLAEIVVAWAKDCLPLQTSRIQRQCLIGYNGAFMMLEALLCSRIAVHFHNPERTIICLGKDEASYISDYITDSLKGRDSENNKQPQVQTVNAALSLCIGTDNEPAKTNPEGFSIVDGHLNCYTGCDENIIVPEGVTHINRYCFSSNKHIKSVALPVGLTRIDQAAFEDCTLLESISLPRTLNTLGDNAFKGCGKLSELIMPDSIERVYSGAFTGCSELARVRLSENLAYVPKQMFFGCKKLETIRIPDSVEFIEEAAFGGCDSLELAYVPNQTVIYDGAFPESTRIIRI